MKLRPVVGQVVSRGRTDGRTDRQADMMKLRVAFHNFCKSA